MKQPRKPCRTCPFTERCVPGATGGSDPSVYVGQSLGPFRIPCHEFIDYDQPDWKDQCVKDDAPQCVGNAIFRVKIGVMDQMPDALLRVDPYEGDGVFTSLPSFYAYHTGISIEDAIDWLDPVTIGFMRASEMMQASFLKQGV